jgi:hypothetical protein
MLCRSDQREWERSVKGASFFSLMAAAPTGTVPRAGASGFFYEQTTYRGHF